MLVCNNCHNEVEENFDVCWSCGKELKDNTTEKKEGNTPYDVEREMNMDGLEEIDGIDAVLKKISGYFQFKNMITTSIIKTLYAFGVIGIIMYSIELINESSGYGANEDLKLYGFALLIFGNLFWRLICEGWILFFSIHESLVSIENNTKNN